MRLYACWGLVKTAQAGHPCRNAHDALVAAGYEPEVVQGSRIRDWAAQHSG